MALMQGNIDDVVKILKDDQEKDYFNCICITARVRKGKSRLAYMLTRKLDTNFSYETNYIGNPKHFQTFKKLYQTAPKSTAWIDEAEKVLSAERRFDKEQWYLQQLFNQFASHNKIIILCTPSFKRIDSRWRDTHITIWINIVARGLAVLCKSRDMQSSLDVWGLEAMKESELALKSEDIINKDRLLKNFDKNPTALFYFTFNDWDSEEEKAEYLTYKEKSQQDLYDEFANFEKFANTTKDKSVQLNLGRIVSYFNFKYQISLNELSTLTGATEDKLREYRDLFIEQLTTNEEYATSLPPKYFNDEFKASAKAQIELGKI